MTCDVCKDDQFPASIVGNNLVCIVCNPKMPQHIREWLTVNNDVQATSLKCPGCREWYASIDHLAPYHWETCWCAKCQTYPRRPSDDAPRSNDGTQRPGSPDGSLATETRKPGSLQ